VRRNGSWELTGPKRLGGLSEQTWPPASNKAGEAGQLTPPVWGTEGLRVTRGTDPLLTRMARSACALTAC
jgi:hypothetical protein